MAARLRGGEPLINGDEVFSLFLQLVTKEVPEHTESIVGNSLAKSQRLRYCFQVHVFYAHGIIEIGYLSTLLVAKVLSLIRHLPCDTVNFLLLLLIAIGALYTMRQLPLFCSQAFLSTAIPMLDTSGISI